MKILYLEDDINLSVTIEEFLSDEGFSVTTVYDGDEALEKLFKENFDLFILDVNVPNINGFDLLKNLREANIDTPAIFTTSLNSIDDLSRGYSVGADDYLKKPFLLKELLFRVKALLKREYRTQDDTLSVDKNTTFNINLREVNINGQKFTLNQKEAQLLKLLIKNIDKCVTQEEIFENVWSFDEEHSPLSLRTYIKDLRKVIGKDKIVTIKKKGYMLVSE